MRAAMMRLIPCSMNRGGIERALHKFNIQSKEYWRSFVGKMRAACPAVLISHENSEAAREKETKSTVVSHSIRG